MMNKAQKKVLETKVIEEIYTLALERADAANDTAEAQQREVQELLEQEADDWRIESRKNLVEEYKARTEAFKKIAEQLFKLM